MSRPPTARVWGCVEACLQPPGYQGRLTFSQLKTFDRLGSGAPVRTAKHQGQMGAVWVRAGLQTTRW